MKLFSIVLGAALFVACTPSVAKVAAMAQSHLTRASSIRLVLVGRSDYCEAWRQLVGTPCP